MSNKVTLKQLAEELNLSVSTISKALKNSYEINENTIVKVQALAKKYNYRPNRMALSLKTNSTRTIGVIIPNILNYFFSKVLLGIEEEANKNGYQIIICLSNNKYEKELESFQLLSDGSVDGFILSIAKETQIQEQNNHFTKIINDGYPIVMFDRVSDSVDCDKVIIDDFDAAYNATSYLLKKGRKKIAIISTMNDLGIGKHRMNGYRKALKNDKNYINDELIIKVHDKNDFETAITSLFNDHKDLDGIFATDNVSATTALKIAHKKGLDIPKNISVIGFSDDKVSRLAYPTLTVISQSAREMGVLAAKTLIERLNKRSQKNYNTNVIKTDLVFREST